MVYINNGKIVFSQVELPASAGVFRLIFSDKGLYSILFPEAALKTGSLVEYSHLAIKNLALKDFPWSEFLHSLERYLGGEKVNFNCPLDFRGYSSFTKDVLTKARQISHGTVRTYGWLAGELGVPGGARAVGQALGKNRHPIVIPCHRVVRSGGELGGFTGGLSWKRYLLSLEKVL